MKKSDFLNNFYGKSICVVVVLTTLFTELGLNMLINKMRIVEGKLQQKCQVQCCHSFSHPPKIHI